MKFTNQAALSVKLLPYSAAKKEDLRIIVSNKVTKKATQRNLIKRRIKEIWRSMFDHKPHPAICVYIRKPALAMSFAELKTELAKALK